MYDIVLMAVAQSSQQVLDEDGRIDLLELAARMYLIV